jgi:hypothetical protein
MGCFHTAVPGEYVSSVLGSVGGLGVLIAAIVFFTDTNKTHKQID